MASLDSDSTKPFSGWRQRLHTVIFESDTPAGRRFDLLLLSCIVISVLVVIVDSVASMRVRYGGLLMTLEWAFTLLFTVEYVLRLMAVRRPLSYARSFFGIVDLLAIVPTYLSLLFPGAHYLLVIRILRMLRIFRIFKLGEYLHQSNVLTRALWASRYKISVFLLTVLLLNVIIGALMYVVEGEESGFTDIPTGIYWAVVTLTTVGYGDISPKTPLGQALASLVMMIGYGIIAVPTGIVTLELRRASIISNQVCPTCALEGHDADARFCKRCGSAL